YVEPIITKAKDDTTHSRRTVFSYLQNKETVTILFREIAEKVANRPGGYTRIIKMENRLGDNAEMAMIELVDYNTVYGADAAQTAKKSTRRRGGSGKGKVAATTAAAPVEEVAVEEAPVAEAVVEETPVAEAPAAEEAPEAPTAEGEENAEKGE
ncbi:MAG TPA: 50S ribosomal protein L17, partial [Mucilaginibacter sp.]|nr:50S ribosomal protein L17 [Mucilaginibacter sp.]